MKGDRWDWARDKAANAFTRYMRSFPSYGSRERQIAESAFGNGFRSGVVNAEARARTKQPKCRCAELGLGGCAKCYTGPLAEAGSPPAHGDKP